MTLWGRALKCFLPVWLCLSSMLFLSFFRTCACFGHDPLASSLPLSPPEQTAPCRMDFLYTMPHCVLTPLLDTSGDLRTKKKKRERKTTGNVKEIFQITSSPCWEDSAVRSHKFVTCIQSSFCSGDHCKHLCFVVFFSPCGSASPLQHRGQLPLPAAATRVSTPDSSLVYQVRHNYRKKKSGLCAL